MRVGDVLDFDRCVCGHPRSEHKVGRGGVFCDTGISVVDGQVVVTCFCTEFTEPMIRYGLIVPEVAVAL